MQDIKDYFTEKSKMLPTRGSISFMEAASRASECLQVLADIAEWKHLFNDTKISRLTIQTATYAQELSKGTAKTMTENKVTAEASKEYSKAREDFERIDNDISYLKAQFEIYTNAHVFYRQLSKQEG